MMYYVSLFLLCCIVVPTAICWATAAYLGAVHMWLSSWERIGRWRRRRAARRARQKRLLIEHAKVDYNWKSGQFFVPWGQRDMKGLHK